MPSKLILTIAVFLLVSIAVNAQTATNQLLTLKGGMRCIKRYSWVSNLVGKPAYKQGQMVALTKNLNEVVIADIPEGEDLTVKKDFYYDTLGSQGHLTLLDLNGNFAINPPLAKIDRYDMKGKLETFDIAASVGENVRKQDGGKISVVPNLGNYQISNRFTFGFNFYDLQKVQTGTKLDKHPLFGVFEFSSRQFKYFGTMPAGKSSAWAYSVATYDSLTNLYLAGHNATVEIQAFNADGQLVRTSTLPDSIKALFKMHQFSKAPAKPQQLQVTSLQHLTTDVLPEKSFTLTNIIRINMDMVAIELLGRSSAMLLVFDNQLNYVGRTPINKSVTALTYQQNKTYSILFDKPNDHLTHSPIKFVVDGR